MKNTERRLLTVTETAEIFGMSPRTLYNKVCRSAKHKFPVKPKKIGKLIRFDIRDIDDYLNSI